MLAPRVSLAGLEHRWALRAVPTVTTRRACGWSNFQKQARKLSRSYWLWKPAVAGVVSGRLASMTARGLPTKFSERKRQREVTWVCSCKTCAKGIEEGSARVEVAVTLGKTVPEGPISWCDGEPMAFHRTCWQQLLTQSAFTDYAVMAS